MGLETVEFVMEIEERFDISIPNEEVVHTGTVGEIAQLVARKLSEKEGREIGYEEPLPAIIDLLVEYHGMDRSLINTTSHVVYDLGMD